MYWIDNGNQLHIYDGDSRLFMLLPPQGSTWDGYRLSVCGDETTGWMAETDWGSKTLTIYNATGESHTVQPVYSGHLPVKHKLSIS